MPRSNSDVEALLEIGTEHLPARFVSPGLSQMSASAARLLQDDRLPCAEIKVYGTLRRLALHLLGLSRHSNALERTLTGPPAGLLKDSQGNFTAQAAGFAKAQGVRPEELETVRGPKGEVLAVRRVTPGEPAIQVLSRVFPAIIRGLEFAKNMEWEGSRFQFARPIRSITALYGERIVPFSLAGISSGNKTQGAAIGSDKIRIASPAGYVGSLRDHCILVDTEERRGALSKTLDGALRASPGVRLEKDSGLLDELVYLTEHPVAVGGRFSRDFLGLPPFLLTTVLKKQLKFFPLQEAAGKLFPGFIGIRDGVSEAQDTVREGYERVLEARLCDARFYFDRDRRSSLRAKTDALRRAAFQRDMGSMHDKMERTVELAIWICGALWRKRLPLDLGCVEAIARLAYADLVTEIVGEFPELQGSSGGYYARLDGEEERVALGIEEFHYPLSSRSPLPTHLEGSVVALAGKMDSLAALFLAGHRPTGSEDPFALRRAGTGIVRIVLEKQLPISLPQLAAQARRLIEKGGAPSENRKAASYPGAGHFEADLREFLWQRAQACFQESGYPMDEIRSVEEGGLDHLAVTFKRLAALSALRAHEDFGELVTAFKRAANILRQAGPALVSDLSEVDRNLVTAEAELSLFEALGRAEKSLFEKLNRDEYERALRELIKLRPFVDRFFESVRVMDCEEAVKRNRLALLLKLASLFKSVADISQLQITAAPAAVANPSGE
ncbi:MAG: glycine--tRNA ligase subunit beta [Elusimicrobia bacterium]|nr:glycine--tRNA ligase subunit beta [Elusimicrobiota bacterium]